MSRPLALLIAGLFLSLALSACGGGGEEAAPGGESPAASPSGGTVTIDIWHSETASNADTLEALISRYNSSQNEVKVRAAFQGTPADLIAKVTASLGSRQVPAIALLDEVEPQRMIDSGAIKAVQDFVDRDDYDLSDLNQTLVRSYTAEDKLWAMPFCAGMGLLYYNKMTFREVGLDPEKPPSDLEEVRQYSEKILKRDGSGNVVRSGIALDIQDWPERMVAEHGDLLVDNENGHEGRATKVLFDNDTGRWYFQWWHDMVDSGLALNVGRNPTFADGLLALPSDRAAMTFSYSSALRSVVDALASGVEGVDMAVAALPGVPGGTGVPYLINRGLWIINLRPEEEQEASWKFVKWMMEPEQQAEWFAGSGYLPVRRAALDLPAAKDIVAKYPQFQVPLDLYLNNPATSAAQSVALLGPFPQVREELLRAVESMLAGAQTPDEALASAAAESNRIIEEYNKRIED